MPLLDPDHERLDHPTEIELAVQVEAGVLAGEALLSRRWPSATPAELALVQERGTEAEHRLVTANLGLVALAAAEMARRSGAVQADLFQEGCVGLIDAVRRWDHARGLRFSTYALHRIRAAVSAAALAARTGPGFSASRARDQRRLRAVAGELGHRLGREPTVAEIAAADGHEPTWVETILQLGDAASLDAVTDETTARAGTDTDDSWPGVALLDLLSPATAAVLRLRYGFGPAGRPQSRLAVAAALGLPTSAVRRLERQGLEALRAQTPYAWRELLHR